jgi:hypothetical protein
MGPTLRVVELEIHIAAEPARVFETVVDIEKYNSWLPHSDVFNGTTHLSDHPAKKGTKYEEHSKFGVRHGEIGKIMSEIHSGITHADPQTSVELDRTTKHVVFQQPHTLFPALLGLVIGVTVDMTVVDDSAGIGCTLKREVRLSIPWGLSIAGGQLEKFFKDESWRVMERLKECLEELNV